MTTDRVHPAGGALVDGDLPRLPDPPATPAVQLAPPILSAPPPSASSVGTPVPPMPGAARSSQSWTIESIQEEQRATNRQLRAARRGSRRPWWQRLLLILGIASFGTVVVIILVFLAQRALGELEGRRLPQYGDVRPSYGTVIYEVVERDVDGIESRATFGSNGSGTHAQMDMVVGGERTEIRRTPSSTFVLSDGAWSAVDETPDLAATIDVSTRVAMFNDLVPDVARSYTTVVNRVDVVLDGRRLTRVDLVLDDDGFERDQPDAHAEWLVFVGEPERVDDRAFAHGVDLSVWTDERGVIWRWESRSDASPAFTESELVRLDDEEFEVVSPFELAGSDGGGAGGLNRGSRRDP